MKAHFSFYPKIWGLKTTDKNIDHRRVPNLMTYFKRKGADKPITDNPKDYLPGDIVCWNLGGSITHIGIVVDKKSQDKFVPSNEAPPAAGDSWFFFVYFSLTIAAP